MTETTKVEIPAEVQRSPTALNVLRDIDALVARAQLVNVENAEQYVDGVNLCRQIAAALQSQEAERLAITRPMDAAKQKVMDLFRRASAPLEAVDKVIRGKLKAYDAEQERIAAEKRAEAERKAEAERQAAARKAREEQERADARAREEREKAEQAKREAEAAREREQAAKAAGDAAAAAAARQEAAKASAAAVRAEIRADDVAAKGQARVERIQAHAESIVAPVILDEKPKAEGASRRGTWKYRVVDESKVDRKFLMLDESKIAKQCKALGKDAEEIVGGIAVYWEADLSIRAAKS